MQEGDEQLKGTKYHWLMNPENMSKEIDDKFRNIRMMNRPGVFDGTHQGPTSNTDKQKNTKDNKEEPIITGANGNDNLQVQTEKMFFAPGCI
jgi:hypothetical protein